VAAVGAIHVEGVAELKRAFNRVDRQLAVDLEGVMLDAIEPIRSSAEQLADERISHIGNTWRRMRIGIARGGAVTYVAPKTHRGGGSPRSNLAPLLMNQAMLPALEAHREEVVLKLEVMLDRVIRRF
jgi:hypothetical protein